MKQLHRPGCVFSWGAAGSSVATPLSTGQCWRADCSVSSLTTCFWLGLVKTDLCLCWPLSFTACPKFSWSETVAGVSVN